MSDDEKKKKPPKETMEEKKDRRKKIINSVIITELKVGANGKVGPSVALSYPEGSSSESNIRSVAQFCFPDLTEFPKAEMEDELFSFVLTEDTGDRCFGYCLRKLPPGSGPRFPIAFTVMAYFPCYHLYSNILDQIVMNFQGASLDLIRVMLDNVMNCELPDPGQIFEVTLHDGTKLQFHRPDEEDSQLEHVNFEPILNCLDVKNIMTVFASLLVERRTIFVGSRLGTISSCVQSCLALLYPFTWQHICIPVLPQTLLSFCCAPMPFVVGVMRNHLPEVMTLPMEQVLIVDVDNNQFLRRPSDVDDCQLLPDEFWVPIEKALRETIKQFKRSKERRKKVVDQEIETKLALYDSRQLTNSLADVFLQFFVLLLGDYRRFFSDKSRFEREDFIESQNTWELKQFMELFCGSQMFEMFISDKQKNYYTNSKFEKRVKLEKLIEHQKKSFIKKDEESKKGSKIMGTLRNWRLKLQIGSAPAELNLSGPVLVSQSRDIQKYASSALSHPTYTPPSSSSSSSSPSAGLTLNTARTASEVDNTQAVSQAVANALEQGSMTVTLSNLEIKNIPSVIVNRLMSFSSIDLSSNRISTLDSAFSNLSHKLVHLNLSSNELVIMPSAILSLSNLESLDLKSNRLIEIPATISRLSKLQTIKISNNQLTSIDPLAHCLELRSIYADQNKISSLPEQLSDLEKLKTLRLNSNDLTIILNVNWTKFVHLRKLSLDRNKIVMLPNKVGPDISKVVLSCRRNPLDGDGPLAQAAESPETLVAFLQSTDPSAIRASPRRPPPRRKATTPAVPSSPLGGRPDESNGSSTTNYRASCMGAPSGFES